MPSASILPAVSVRWLVLLTWLWGSSARADMIGPPDLSVVGPVRRFVVVEPEDEHAYVLAGVMTGYRAHPPACRPVIAGVPIELGSSSFPTLVAVDPGFVVSSEFDPPPAGPTSPSLDDRAVSELRVASVTDFYAAHVEADAVVVRLLRSEYVHHGGATETVPALPDGTRGLPGFGLLDGPMTFLGAVTSCCCWPCCPLGAVAAIVGGLGARWARGRRKATA